QRRADAMALPAVLDRQAEFQARILGMQGIARLADDGLETVDHHGRDHGETFDHSDMREAVEHLRRQLVHRAEEAVVAGAGRQRAVIVLQILAVARLDETHGDLLALPRTQHVGILLEIVEAKRAHGRLPSKRNWPAPLIRRRRRRWLPFKPARTAFRFRGRYRSTTG